MNIAKAGWLHRESTFLHRWKRSWVVLYTTGELMYYDTPDSREAEERILLYACCTVMKTGKECDFNPPPGKSKECLIRLMMRNFEDLKLCAESPDDMSAWKLALEDARAMNPNVAQPGQQVIYPHTLHGGYGGDVLVTGGQYVVRNAAMGPAITGNTVYVDDDPYYSPYWNRRYRRRRYGGPFMGPAMYGPVMFW